MAGGKPRSALAKGARTGGSTMGVAASTERTVRHPVADRGTAEGDRSGSDHPSACETVKASPPTKTGPDVSAEARSLTQWDDL